MGVKLAAQVSQTVQWSDWLQSRVKGDASDFLELGPGGARSDMVARAHSGTSTRSVEEFRDFQGVRGWLARQLLGR